MKTKLFVITIHDAEDGRRVLTLNHKIRAVSRHNAVVDIVRSYGFGRHDGWVVRAKEYTNVA